MRRDGSGPLPPAPRRIGRVVGGSVSGGLEVRLDAEVSVEEMGIGRFVTVEGNRRRFLCLVTDVRLKSVSDQVASVPPDYDDPFIARVMGGIATYGVLQVLPTLVLPPTPEEPPEPVKTVPVHFAPVYEATADDLRTVYGDERQAHNFQVGSPLEMPEVPLCIDIRRLVERSNGVFGKSGTGKSFLTRLLLLGIIRSGLASVLVFDMHNEYGWKAEDKERRVEVKGLRQLYGSSVVVFTLDEESSRRRDVRYDSVVEIGYNELEIDDLLLLAEPLHLSSRAPDLMAALERYYGQNWLREFLSLEGPAAREELAKDLGFNLGVVAALYQSLGRLKRLAFLKPEADSRAVELMLNYLKQGRSVVLEFGRTNDLLAYMLVANVLTRRIHRDYVTAKEKFLGGFGDDPKPLVVVIEEAHKFLSPAVAQHTIFGTIAREMRKYNVTLLVVDQRPSGIDEEVMSQLGTRFICSLDNERDLESVLTGVAGRSELRTLLARLDTRQQALVLGHAVPIPTPIRVRDYDESLYRGLRVDQTGPPDLEKDLFGDWSS
ncbi:MAG: ATPase [Chloroflexota bacterium]